MFCWSFGWRLNSIQFRRGFALSMQFSANLCASGEPEQKSQSFAKISHGVRWQDGHCYVACGAYALRSTPKLYAAQQPRRAGKAKLPKPKGAIQVLLKAPVQTDHGQPARLAARNRRVLK